MLSLNISKCNAVYKHTNIVGNQYNKYYTINSIDYILYVSMNTEQ